MGEPAASGERLGRESGTPARSARRPWSRVVAATAMAFALALPVLSVTEAVRPQPAAAAPDLSCSTAASTLPATRTDRETVAARAAALWFPAEQVAMATAVAGAESSWNRTAVNQAAGGNFGLWQINSVHKALLRAKNWTQPVDNAWMAFQVWDAADGVKGDGRGSWRPWSVYNSGSYRAYLRDSAPAVVAQDGPECVEPMGSSEVRVATWNILASNSKGRIAEGVRELTTKADVFGLQEMGSPSDRATAARAAVGFTMTTDRTAVPIFYRTDKYTAIDQGRVRAFSAGQKIESRADGSRTKDKWVTWVQLRDNTTQETIYVVNTHLLVGAYNSSKQAKRNDRRVALYNKQLDTLTGLVDNFQATGAAAYITCDCNVNYRPDSAPVATLSDHGISPNWQHLSGKPTIGKKTRLDYVWSNRAPVAQVVGDKHGSDHSPVIVTYPPSTGVSGTMTPVNGSPSQEIYSMRTITDPSSGQTYLVPIPTGRVGDVLTKALDQVGDQWRFGGDGPNTWDCSGLTAAAWQAAGVRLPHQSEEQQASLENIALSDAQAGDIFWREGYVSIYLGTAGGQRIAVGAAKSKGAVVIHAVEEDDIKAVLHPAG